MVGEHSSSDSDTGTVAPRCVFLRVDINMDIIRSS